MREGLTTWTTTGALIWVGSGWPGVTKTYSYSVTTSVTRAFLTRGAFLTMGEAVARPAQITARKVEERILLD